MVSYEMREGSVLTISSRPPIAVYLGDSMPFLGD